jgi:ABC-type glycerol-3-phosphate transport system substrate-binding protein
MWRKSILLGGLALALAACGSTRQQQTTEQPAATGSGMTVVQLEQPTDTELRADVGGTVLKISTTQDGKGTISTEVKYLGLAENGRIKLRVLSTDAPDAVEVDQDPAEAFAVEAFQVEFIEAQSSWVRYRITSAGGGS